MAACLILVANFIISIVQCEKGLNNAATDEDKELAQRLDFVEMVFTFIYLAELLLNMVCLRMRGACVRASVRLYLEEGTDFLRVGAGSMAIGSGTSSATLGAFSILSSSSCQFSTRYTSS